MIPWMMRILMTKMAYTVVCLLALIATIEGFPSFGEHKGDTPTYHTVSVYCKGVENCDIKPGILDFEHATAIAAFNDTLLTQGWGILDITAGFAPAMPSMDSHETNNLIVIAAGIAEAYLTARQIHDQFINFYGIWFPNPDDERVKNDVKKWLSSQQFWAEEMMRNNTRDPYWAHALYLRNWLQGMFKQYNFLAEKDPKLTPRDWLDFLLLQASGSVGDLIKVVDRSRRTNWSDLRPNDILEARFNNSRCSALIKLTPGFEDMFLSHSTWFRYESTARIYKTYQVNLTTVEIPNKKISFSSYGGNLASVDAFYNLGGKMAVLQTSNDIFNNSLYNLVNPGSLLTWQRVLLANWRARNGKEWAEIFARENSGTYNNQYMVVNLELVQPKKPLQDNTLWVAEQIPGLVESRDMTHVLTDGYFPSYNIPVFENIFNLSGYPAMVKKVGSTMSYGLAPRAKIFRRDQSRVRNLEDLKKLMRSNDYKQDPYSQGNPTFAVCARGDLRELNPTPYGCYDTKATNLARARQMEADIIMGPTLGTDLKPFSWIGSFAKYSHVGLPDVYNFSFISVKPRFP